MSWFTNQLAKFTGSGKTPIDPTLQSNAAGMGRRTSNSKTDTLGSISVAVYGGDIVEQEKDARLTGVARYRTFSDMLVNNPIVSASVLYFLGLIGKAQWTFQPADDQSKEAKEIAEFVEKCLTEDPITSWETINKRAAIAKFWGFAIQEWTMEKNDKGEFTFYDIALRAQRTIERWDLNYDGTINGIIQRSEQDSTEIYIPRSKFLYTVDNAIHDSPRGEGLFRMVVKHIWYLKLFEKLEGIAYETDLNGIPVVKAPLVELMSKLNKGDITKTQIQEIMGAYYDFIEKRNRGEKAPGMLIDSEPYRTLDDRQSPSSTPQFNIELLTGNAQFMKEISEAIMREDRRIARVFGTESLVLGETSGSYALSEDKTHQFLMHVDGQLRSNAKAIMRDLIMPLLKMNGIDEELMPDLVPESVRFRDIQQVASALTALATAGLMPNDPAWNEVRAMAGISPIPQDIAESMEEEHIESIEMKREAFANSQKESEMKQKGNGNGKDKN